MNNDKSIYTFYKKLNHLRNEDKTLIYGDFNDLLITKNVFVYERTYQNKKYIIALNFSKKKRSINYNQDVVLSNYERNAFDGQLMPYEGIIMKG